MVQATTDGTMATDTSSSSSAPDPPSWFTYQGPKISASVSLGAAKTLTFYGFKAVTNIVHTQSIAWGTATVAANGPLQTELTVKGARKTVSMDLGATLTLAPGGFIHRKLAESTAQGVVVSSSGGQTNTNSSNTTAQVVAVQTTGSQTSTGPTVNANVNTNQA